MSKTRTTTPANRPGPLADGETIAVPAGNAIVVVQCIRPGAAYRMAIRNSDGFEIADLSQSFEAEHIARGAARTITLLLRHGYTAQELAALVIAGDAR